MMCMDKIIKHKSAYIKSFEDAIVGNEFNTSYPNANSSSPYHIELNEEQEVSTFAYNFGRTIKENLKVSDNGDNNDGGISTAHNHDDRYAKIVHNHDDRYYTKLEVDEWRDRLINGDLLFNKINANHIQAGTIVAGSTIITNGASRSIALAIGTVYLPQGGGNNSTEHARFGAGIMACPSSGTFHFLTASGNATRIYASNVSTSYSLESIMKISETSALDQIDSVSVVNTSEGLRLTAPTTRMCSDESSVVTTTYNEKTNQEEVSVDYNSAISTLWKAIQELRKENEELKKLIKGEI